MSGEKKTEVAMPSADYVLQTPLQVIGVQKETPICWSPDGSLLAFVLGNKTISIFRPISEGPRAGEYEVRGVWCVGRCAWGNYANKIRALSRPWSCWRGTQTM